MKLLPIVQAVFCPWTHQLHAVGLCADCCDHYVGSGINDDSMRCNYQDNDLR
jgi:hypothetical protein